MEQPTDERATGQTTVGRIVWGGPYKGKTCHVQRADRIKVRTELGMDTSRVIDVSLLNFPYRNAAGEIDRDALEQVKAALIVLIGGHTVALAQVHESSHGVYPANLYAPCKEPPPDADILEFGNKTWINIGTYLAQKCSDGGVDPDQVREERDSWRGER